MKRSFRHFALTLLLALSASIAPAAQPSPATKTDSTAAPQVKWTQIESEEVKDIKLTITNALQKGANGRALDKNELALMESKLEWAQRRQAWEVEINFPGGPLADLIKQLRGPDGVAFTVVSSGAEPLLQTELPPLSLRNATLHVVAKLIGHLLETRGVQLRILDDSKPNWVVGMLVRVRPQVDAVAPPGAFESIQLGEYIFPAQTVETIVEAIRTAWELNPKNDRDALKLKYHPPTKILLVSGPLPAIVVTKTVIGSLRKSPGNATP